MRVIVNNKRIDNLVKIRIKRRAASNGWSLFVPFHPDLPWQRESHPKLSLVINGQEMDSVNQLGMVLMPPQEAEIVFISKPGWTPENKI